MFEHCKLPFGGSLAVWVVVSAFQSVSEFHDGIEVDSVIDNLRVDRLVGIAFEERRDVHHLVLVIAALPGVACQFCL